jgi:hypothetical protein
MNGVTNAVVKIRSIINIIIFVVVLGALAVAGYFYFFTSKELKSDDGRFSVSIPGKYSFKANDKADDSYGMAVYEPNKGLYIFGKTYDLTEGDMLASTNEDKVKFVESAKGRNASEVVEKDINGLKGYTYNFEYTDSNNENYFMKVIWIKGKKGTYLLDVECPTAKKGTYEKELDKIANTFKELEA